MAFTQVNIKPETLEKIRILATAAKMKIGDYIALVIADQWEAYLRKDVPYDVIQEKEKEDKAQKWQELE